jgi:hypothetical protein
VIGDEALDPALVGVGLLDHGLEARQPVAGELDLDARQPPEQPGRSSTVSSRDEVGRRGRVARNEHDEIGMEAVADPRCLGHEVVAGLDQELQLTCRVW